MKKRLQLYRETLVKLDSHHAGRVLGGVHLVHETYDSGETYCWCSRGCPVSDGCSGESCDCPPVETSRCNAF